MVFFGFPIAVLSGIFFYEVGLAFLVPVIKSKNKQEASGRMFCFSRDTENTCPANSLCFVNAVATVVFVSSLPFVKGTVLPHSPLQLK